MVTRKIIIKVTKNRIISRFVEYLLRKIQDSAEHSRGNKSQ